MTNTANASVLQEEVALPFGIRARFQWSRAVGLAVRWHPEPPTLRTRRARSNFWEAYRKSRDLFLQKAANAHGLRIAVADELSEGEYSGLRTFEPAQRN